MEDLIADFRVREQPIDRRYDVLALALIRTAPFRAQRPFGLIGHGFDGVGLSRHLFGLDLAVELHEAVELRLVEARLQRMRAIPALDLVIPAKGFHLLGDRREVIGVRALRRGHVGHALAGDRHQLGIGRNLRCALADDVLLPVALLAQPSIGGRQRGRAFIAADLIQHAAVFDAGRPMRRRGFATALAAGRFAHIHIGHFAFPFGSKLTCAPHSARICPAMSRMP